VLIKNLVTPISRQIVILTSQHSQKCVPLLFRFCAKMAKLLILNW